MYIVDYIDLAFTPKQKEFRGMQNCLYEKLLQLCNASNLLNKKPMAEEIMKQCDTVGLAYDCMSKEGVMACMEEAIRRALILASENAKVAEVYQDGRKPTTTGHDSIRVFCDNGPDSIVIVDKQSILEVAKLVKI